MLKPSLTQVTITGKILAYNKFWFIFRSEYIWHLNFAPQGNRLVTSSTNSSSSSVIFKGLYDVAYHEDEFDLCSRWEEGCGLIHKLWLSTSKVVVLVM